MSTSSARRPRTSTPATPTAPIAKGRVIFVGTGPGDPDLLTLGAIAALADASSVILDNDRQREILAHPAITLAESAEVITLGLTEARKRLSPSARAKIVLKRANGHSYFAVEQAIRLIASGKYPLSELCTHSYGLADVGLAIRTVAGDGVPGGIHVSVLPWREA